MFLFVIIFCVSALFLYLRRNYSYWKDRGIPYEEPSFLLGNLTFIMRKSPSEVFNALKNKHPSDYVGIFLGWKPALVVHTPELTRNIITKDFDHFQNRFIASSAKSDPLGALNLFTVNNPTWSSMRHEITPMFTSLRLKYVTEYMNKNATELVKKIKRDYIDKKQPVNLKELFCMYTSDTAGSSVFGIQVSSLNDPNTPIWFIVTHMITWTFWRGFEFASMFLLPSVAALLKLSFFSTTSTEYIKKLFYEVVKERKITAKSTDKDLVTHLVKLKENSKIPAGGDPQLTDDLMLAQTAFFIFGTIMTSSTTLSLTLHELAHHPEEQEKLYEEISGAVKRSGKDILEYEDLLELKYLTACILETLRKHPPVPYLDRVCNKKYKLTDDVTIEEGTPVFVNVLALHQDPNVFPEPHKWQPERMDGITENDNIHFSYLPFGDGPRFCIGKRYGMMQIRAAIAQMIMKYKFEPSDPYEFKHDPYSVLLAPLNGGRVKFVLR